MWSMDYVQVPAEEEKPEEVVVAKEKNKGQSNEENQTETTKKRVHELVKQMSISAEGSGKLAIFDFSLSMINIYINNFVYNGKFHFFFRYTHEERF